MKYIRVDRILAFKERLLNGTKNDTSVLYDLQKHAIVTVLDNIISEYSEEITSTAAHRTPEQPPKSTKP